MQVKLWMCIEILVLMCITMLLVWFIITNYRVNPSCCFPMVRGDPTYACMKLQYDWTCVHKRAMIKLRCTTWVVLHVHLYSEQVLKYIHNNTYTFTTLQMQLKKGSNKIMLCTNKLQPKSIMRKWVKSSIQLHPLPKPMLICLL
jgi:hypothetical protein